MEEQTVESYKDATSLSSRPRKIPQDVEQTPPGDHTHPNRRTEPSPTPQSHPSSSPTQSCDASRSPSTSRRSIKRTSTTISPVLEEQPPHASTSSNKFSTDPQPPTKRSRTVADPDSKRRGQRLFGVLTSTLSQFKRESESDRAASLANKRAAIEARLANKLKDSEKVIDALQRKRSLVWEARQIAEAIATGDAQRKTLRGMKRRMASFLFTPHRAGSNKRSRATAGEKLAGDIPTSLTPTSKAEDRDGEYAVYFLPGKALLEQEDALNQQEDDVDEEIDRFDDRWDARREQLLERLDDVKRRIREA